MRASQKTQHLRSIHGVLRIAAGPTSSPSSLRAIPYQRNLRDFPESPGTPDVIAHRESQIEKGGPRDARANRLAKNHDPPSAERVTIGLLPLRHQIAP